MTPRPEKESKMTEQRKAHERRSKRVSLEETLGSIAKGDLNELFRFWVGKEARAPKSAAELRERVAGQMDNPETLKAKVAGLGSRHEAILSCHLRAPRFQCSRTDLVNAKELNYLSSYDLDAALLILQRCGLLTQALGNNALEYETKTTAIPREVGESLTRSLRSEQRGIFDAFTLRGHLDRLYEDPARAKRTPPSRVREMYKMYSNEPAAVARIERLPDGLRTLIEKTVLEFGGLLPRALFDRMDTDLPHWNGRRWSKILEESLVGTVSRLELQAHGIQHSDETLIVFNEVALAWLRHVAVPGDPDAPHDEAGLGVDLFSNISRFIGYIQGHDVRFTVRGEIFKTTEKRILQELIPNPGRELEREEVLQFIYNFCKEQRLIESTGERTFALTSAGRDWESHDLQTKLRILVEYACHERDEQTEFFHQSRMRRLYLRLLKRVEPGIWYDLMYVPFLTRNTYLSSFDDGEVEEHFASVDQNGRYAPREDLQRMAWNLVSWVRKRLYLFGLIDLGYDKAKRPVALRLTQTGARFLGMIKEDPVPDSGVGNLVVTPDFEVVLFPTGDDAQIVHDLDRFCRREKNESLFQFRLTDKTIGQALAQGMPLASMTTLLETHSRTPVPQNVLVSIQDWAARAGLLFLSSDHTVRSQNSEVLARFGQDPGVRPHILRRLDENRVKMKSDVAPGRLQGLLRELDYLVELVEG